MNRNFRVSVDGNLVGMFGLYNALVGLSHLELRITLLIHRALDFTSQIYVCRVGGKTIKFYAK